MSGVCVADKRLMLSEPTLCHLVSLCIYCIVSYASWLVGYHARILMY